MGPTKIRDPDLSATVPCICVVLVPPHREKVGEGKEKEEEREVWGWRDSDSITVKSVLSFFTLERTRVNSCPACCWLRLEMQPVP